MDIRVTYADTDQMGVVYYSNYLIWFEMVRTEFFRAKGIVYKDLEVKDRIYLPVVEAHCTYKSPVKYDDVINISAYLSEVGRCRLTFEYEIMKEGKLTTTGYTKHVFINDSSRPIEIPEKIRNGFSK
jgi:acyl-CoA thioester hydrolase